MGAWADLTIDAATLKGLAPRTLRDRQLGAVDTARITADMVSMAKGLVEDMVASRIGAEVSAKGGVTQFFDAAAAVSSLAGNLQRMVSHAVLMTYYGEGRLSDEDRYATDRETQEKMLLEAVKAFCAIAPHALGQTQKIGKKQGGASLYSIMQTYDNSSS